MNFTGGFLMGILTGLLTLVLITLSAALVFSLVMYVKQSFLDRPVCSRKVTYRNTVEKVYTNCLKCGQRLSDEYKFCPICGDGLKVQVTEKEPSCPTPTCEVEEHTAELCEQELQSTKITDLHQKIDDPRTRNLNDEQNVLVDHHKNEDTIIIVLISFRIPKPGRKLPG